ncbi:MAG: hypothetical protein IAE93_16130 [Ignavibacteria bacterium]|nr:hypothetical protein [Ignavibacteria bacterium]
MYKVLNLSPMIPSYNIKKTTEFFTGLFSFDVEMEVHSYVVLSKDNLTIHILNAGSNVGQMEFYIEVDNVDALWKSIKGRLEGIKTREPFDREYGMREFHVAIPFTETLLFVGQVL